MLRLRKTAKAYVALTTIFCIFIVTDSELVFEPQTTMRQQPKTTHSGYIRKPNSSGS